jgi:glutamine synthetase adenylyltransferase
VEFAAQALSLEHGWREANTLAAVERAGRERAIDAETAQVLAENYRRLMQIERILRRWSFQAESVLPDDPAPFYRVAVRCGFGQPEDFAAYVKECRSAIRAAYGKVFALSERTERF